MYALLLAGMGDRGGCGMARVDVGGWKGPCVGHKAFQVSVLKFKAYVGGGRIPVKMD